MSDPADDARTRSDDERTLQRLGYAQELQRGMSGFSNLAISMSVICILAGGVTSFHLGLCSVGGAAIGLGWPLACLFALIVAATMGQVASAFPTAGGLYHWAAILGGRGWGWITAWFNLAGLVTVLAAINVGAYEFVTGALGPSLGCDPKALSPGGQMIARVAAMAVLTGSQALFNHAGIRTTTCLTDFSGYWILFVASLLTISLLIAAPHLTPARLVTFTNFSGLPEGETAVWPHTANLAWLFLLGLLLPAYTLTGFDASAHAAEETIGASTNVPRGIVRSVLISGLFGWLMLSALVLAAPNLEEAARAGDGAFVWIIRAVLPGWLAATLFAGIALAQYLCGLATVTSASRMVYAFARDGGMPWSSALRRVSSIHRTPARAIWLVAGLAVAFTVYSPVYATLSIVCAMFLYVSYVLPAALASPPRTNVDANGTVGSRTMVSTSGPAVRARLRCAFRPRYAAAQRPQPMDHARRRRPAGVPVEVSGRQILPRTTPRPLGPRKKSGWAKGEEGGDLTGAAAVTYVCMELSGRVRRHAIVSSEQTVRLRPAASPERSPSGQTGGARASHPLPAADARRGCADHGGCSEPVRPRRRLAGRARLPARCTPAYLAGQSVAHLRGGAGSERRPLSSDNHQSVSRRRSLRTAAHPRGNGAVHYLAARAYAGAAPETYSARSPRRGDATTAPHPPPPNADHPPNKTLADRSAGRSPTPCRVVCA